MFANVTPLPLARPKVACTECGLRKSCLPDELNTVDLEELDTLVATRRFISRGRSLYHSGDTFSALYAIRNGLFKTDVPVDDGRVQVTGFHMSGELLGMDGIDNERHVGTAVALEDSEVCVVPFAQLELLSCRIETLMHRLHRFMSREIVRGHRVMTLLGTMGAKERLANFLVDLSRRFYSHGRSANDFHLPMKRDEIGSYLGLSLETVSRVFSLFQANGFIWVQHRHIRILNIEGLQGMFGQQRRQYAYR